MAFDREYFSLGYLDALSYQNTPIHRLDPRAKLIVTFAYIFTVISFPKYDLSGLVPLLFFPIVLLIAGEIPAGFILKKILLVSPFALCIGIFNPFLDRVPLLQLFGLPVSGGWISFASVMTKFLLTISAGLLLIATTSFPGVCHALSRLGLPEVFVAQLMFLYRYIFVLMEEAMKIVRARDIRSFGKRGRDMKTFTSLVSMLFIRTMARSERIYQAMLSRGFSGSLVAARTYRLSPGDIFFAVMAVSVFLFLRHYNIAMIIGTVATRTLRP
ncbi:MAG: cobalt ECF transporter T component CbiQ [Thermodesulfovibrio sp.]|nr:cobalt ECF transporter T component CbiQ [Thermodesulfovibrio sp.]